MNHKVKKSDPYRLTDTVFSDKYILHGYAGGGGMGAVYLASDQRTQQQVAVKILKPDIVSRSPEYVKLFELEVEAAKRVQHPNIVKIFDSGTHEDIPFMVMEWLDGYTLEDKITQEKLPLEFITYTFRQICDAFIIAHSQSVLHLDIKPANIFLLPLSDGTAFVKIIDFGLSRILSSETGTTATKYRGTDKYSSPEHYGGKLTQRSDVYSLGATLYHMLAGVVPFSTSYIWAKINPNLDLPPIPSILNQRSDLPLFLDRIIEKTLNKNPLDRYQSVKELLTDFEVAMSRPVEVDSNLNIEKEFPVEPNNSDQITTDFKENLSGADPLLLSPQNVGWRRFFGLTSHTLAIDFGSSNTIIYAKNYGIVVSEPTLITINKLTNQIEACGRDAKEMLGRSSDNFSIIAPVKSGVIVNDEFAKKLLRHFILKAIGFRNLNYPRVFTSINTEHSQTEVQDYFESFYSAGASRVFLCDKSISAAIGAGLPVTEPHGTMIVDFGGGMCVTSLISLSSIIFSHSVPIGGNDIDKAITQYIENEHGLLIGQRTAEAIKIALGSAFPLDRPLSMEIRGRDAQEKMPRTLIIYDEEIRNVIEETLVPIINSIKIVLDNTSAECCADLVERGIVLTGGMSLLKNLDKRLMVEFGLPFVISDDPLSSVVIGLGGIISDNRLVKAIGTITS